MTTFRQDIRLGKKVPLMKTDDYNDKSVTTEKLADYAVTTEKVADEAITTRTIAENAVTSECIAAGAVMTANIDKEAVTDRELAIDSVTTEKIADGSITTEKLAAQSILSSKIADQSVLVSKIADEVWEKLKDEYLRRDGLNYMKGTLNMGGYAISRVSEISSPSLLGASIILDGDAIVIETLDADGSADPYHRILAEFQHGEVSFPDGNVLSNGFKTIDRTNIGLLANDATVALALTDSEIDAIASQVFTFHDSDLE